MQERLLAEAGRVVISRAGRDRGTAYVVLTDPAEGRVLVIDGRGRTARRPKRKNVKHLTAKPRMLERFSEMLQNNPERLDQEVRMILNAECFSDT